MIIKLLSCNQDRPDRRAIARMIGDIADGVDHNLANELTDIIIEGSPVDIEVSSNESSAYRALRKADIEYEIVE
jgi:hypothetical protein